MVEQLLALQQMLGAVWDTNALWIVQTVYDVWGDHRDRDEMKVQPVGQNDERQVMLLMDVCQVVAMDDERYAEQVCWKMTYT